MSRNGKRVCYFIYSNKRGASGGHFYTLWHHVRAFRSIVDVNVINVGRGISPVLTEIPETKFFPFVRWNFLELFKIIRYVKRKNPDVLHAYDHKSLLIARVVRLFVRCPIVFTKCGGANGSTHIPHADFYILFSRENYEHYRTNSSNINAELIPNRVYRLESNDEAVSALKSNLGLTDDSNVIIRISRFNRYYNKTFHQTFELYKFYKEREIRSKLVFIGVVQDEDYLRELRKEAAGDPGISFVTDPIYTRNASALLPLADVVVATGRGVMEACYFQKKVFCPSASGKLPTPLTPETMPVLLAHNFSERSPICLDAVPDNVLFVDPKRVFDEYFSIEGKLDDYDRIYSQSRIKGMTFRGMYSFLYHVLQFFRPARRT